MAGQAVNIILVLEIEVFIFPTITNVAGHAFLLVSLGANAEVVNLIFLPDGNWAFPPGHFNWITFPGPMGCLHNIKGYILVAFQASNGNITAVFEGALNDIYVVGVDGSLGYICPGIISRV